MTRPESSPDAREGNLDPKQPGNAPAEMLTEAAAPTSGEATARFSVARVLASALVVATIAVAGGAAWAFGWLTPIQAWFQPALVPATGQVFYEGEPVPGGVILTAPLEGQPAGAMGIIGPDGRFTLRTQVDDRYVDGAFVGRHKVAVNYGKPKMLGVIPLVPEKYFTLLDTVLTVDVSPDAAMNHFELKLEGELTEEALRALGRIKDDGQPPAGGFSGSQRGPGGPPNAGGRRRGGPPPGVNRPPEATD